MRSRFRHLKPRVLALRREGLSYSQICERLDVKVPQSTLSNWCAGIVLCSEAQQKLRERMAGHPYRRAMVSLLARERRQKRRDAVTKENAWLKFELDDPVVAKVALVMLYLGEGRKREQNVVDFANSNPGIIRLFIRLFCAVYEVDYGKMRVTVQCRADQDVAQLESYWRKVVGIPEVRFYRTRADARTAGKPTRKAGYMGVCRISYIDARIQFELVNVGSMLTS